MHRGPKSILMHPWSLPAFTKCFREARIQMLRDVRSYRMHRCPRSILPETLQIRPPYFRIHGNKSSQQWPKVYLHPKSQIMLLRPTSKWPCQSRRAWGDSNSFADLPHRPRPRRHQIQLTPRDVIVKKPPGKLKVGRRVICITADCSQ